ncbi:MAG: hypothetical protein U0441_25110 [Polyangiaceae bacterium]
MVATSPGLAQPAEAEKTPEEKAAALKAFEDGLTAEKNGDYAVALEKFQKVGAFKMTPHVRFHIALCEEKLGKLVSALRGFELAEAEAIKMGKDAQVVADKAPARIEALRKRVASVRIEVKGTVLYSRVVIDGEPVLAKDFGSLINLDPGAHVIGVETDGQLSQKREVTLAEHGYETLTFEIEDKERPVPTATATVTETAPPPPPPPPPSRLPAFIAGGVGVASLIGAGVFYGLRAGALDSFAEQCPIGKYPPDSSGVQHCPVGAQGARDDAQQFTLGAGVLLGVGLAALGGAGAYWYFTQRKPAAKPAPAASIGVSIGPGSLKVIGSF